MLDRFEKIGLQIMSRSGGGGPFEADPIAGVLSDPAKRTVAAQVLGQAYVTAHNLATLNRSAIERVADALEENARSWETTCSTYSTPLESRYRRSTTPMRRSGRLWNSPPRSAAALRARQAVPPAAPVATNGEPV